MVRVILMTDFTEAYARRLLLGISQFARESGQRWSICRLQSTNRKEGDLEEVLQFAKKIRANAIIGQFYTSDDVSIFRENGIIAIAQDFKSPIPDIPNITAHHYMAGKLAADYFLKKGFKSFGFYGPVGVAFSEERYAGFRQAIKEANPEYTVSFFQASDEHSMWKFGLEELNNWLRFLPKPVGVLACDDNWAYHIIEACHVNGQQKGRTSIPADISVLGVDNDETICRLCVPHLSSINQKVEQAGYRVAELISRMLKDPSCKGNNINVELGTIVTRRSSDILVNDNPYITTVLRYIHEHLREKISVDELVSLVPLSRRLLETKFFQSTGSSIYDYIINARVEKMAEYLIEGLTVSEAAFRIGANDTKNISRSFKKIKGMTPMEFRKKQEI